MTSPTLTLPCPQCGTLTPLPAGKKAARCPKCGAKVAVSEKEAVKNDA